MSWKCIEISGLKNLRYGKKYPKRKVLKAYLDHFYEFNSETLPRTVEISLVCVKVFRSETFIEVTDADVTLLEVTTSSGDGVFSVPFCDVLAVVEELVVAVIV